MTSVTSYLKGLLVFIAFFCLSKNAVYSQCAQIESILVAACGTPEGQNEMFRFKVGTTALNTSTFSVNWPSQSWGGLVQNATTMAKVDTLNADIVAAGGCAQLLQPIAGVLPANSSVIVVTSYLFDTAANSFGALTEDTYILFQNSTQTGGHFGNYQPTGTRTLSMSFGGGCSDSVTYTRNLLSDNIGDSVSFTSGGAATYYNNGCSAPVEPFTVDAGPVSMTTCAGAVLNFSGTAQGQQSVQWSATQGTFSSPNTLTTSFTVPITAVGTIAVILSATNSCGTVITDTITLLVNASTTPTFTIDNDLCNGEAAPLLPTTSNNNITGTWSPSTVSSTTSGSYVFTPGASQCAGPYTLNVTVSAGTITPTFTAVAPICSGETLAPLPTTSNNNIVGTWSPALNNTATTIYTFTPDAGQCATTTTLQVTVNNASVVPTFTAVTPICSGETLAPLPTTSNNNITGTWSPALNNTATTTYTFTPDAEQCATTATLPITVNPKVTPTFNAVAPICSGATLAALPTTSTNGIVGTWSPALDNTATTTYTFLPNAGECAVTTPLTITVNPNVTPTFNAVAPICSGETLAPLSTTSTNGIIGTWSPVLNNTATTTYTFLPNSGQCASNQELTIIVNPNVTPTFNPVAPICSGGTLAALPTTSTNGIVGTWSPALNNTATTTYSFLPNAGQCAETTPLTITVNPKAIPTFNAVAPICAGETLAPLPTTSTNGIVGTWSPALNNTATTTYTFTPSVGECAETTPLTITVNPVVTPTFANVNPICEGDNLNPLPAISQNGIAGTWMPALDNTQTTTYTFTPTSGQCATATTLTIVVTNIGATTPITGNDSVCTGDVLQLANATAGGTWSSSDTAVATVDSDGLVTPINAGFAKIYYTTGSICNETFIDITVYFPPSPLLTDRYICVDNVTGTVLSPVNMQCGVPNEDHTFEWMLDGQLLTTTTNLHVATEIGLYEVKVTNNITGCTAIASADVLESSLAIANATVATDFHNNQTITVTVTGGSGDYEYQLDENWPQDSNEFIVQQGPYTIKVIDKNGCGSTVLSVYAINYPRYFTPNNDGYNDTWFIEGFSNQLEAQLFIFDRYGKLVKSIRPYLNEFWDGTLHGHPLPSTDYWFTLKYSDRSGVSQELRSHFSLKR